MSAGPAAGVARPASVGRGSGRLRAAGRIAIVAAAVAGFGALFGPAQLLNALTLGGIYALVALGYTMVYGIVELINFAHGDLFMVGAFVGLWSLTVLGYGAAIGDPALLIVVLAATFLVTMGLLGLLGLLIERSAYRPLRRAPRVAPLIAAIGVSFILQNVIQLLFGSSQVTFPQVVPITWVLEAAGVRVSVLSLVTVGLALVLAAGLHRLVHGTRAGRAFRATAQDREVAALMGVDTDRTIALTFLIGAALAGAAGVVHGLQFGVVRFDLGFQAGLKAFTAAVLGGIGDTTGALIGGFLIGFIEVGAAALGYGRWGPAIVFGLLIAVLVFRPAGLLGRATQDRA